MYLERDPEEDISDYAGPYERWVYSPELGQPYAFPAIADPSSGYFTALLENGDTLPDLPGLATRLPPIWNPLGSSRSVLPFAFHDEAGNDPRRAIEPDKQVARLLSGLTKQAGTSDGAAAPTPRYRVNFPIAPETWVDTYHPDCDMDHWTVPATRPRAIVAVIDDGIPFAHRAFLDSTGKTRVSHVWMQSARAQPHAAVPFGREYMNGDINAMRSRAGGDEAALYRDAGAIDTGIDELGPYLRRATSHGAHVMGIAAGNAAQFDTQPLGDDIQIIAVQLPNTIAWDTSGFGKEMYMLSALHYVMDRARAIATKYADDPENPNELPLIINFSYGWSAGRHDGQSAMETAIEELLVDRKSLQPATALVMPMGNHFDGKMHARFGEEDFDTDALRFGWQIQPHDLTSSYLEIWLPEGMDGAKYTITVTPPKGSTLDKGGRIDIKGSTTDGGDPRQFSELEMGGQNVGQLSADHHKSNRWRVMLALIPSAYTRDTYRRAPSGQWRIEISRSQSAPRLAPDQHIGVWVQRDDDPTSLRSGGRQSSLRPETKDLTPPPPLPGYTDGLGPITGYGAHNGVASSPSTTRVAGYVQQTGRACVYSSGGGLRADSEKGAAPWGQQPDFAAVADLSAINIGAPSIGVLTGARSRLIGTSGAAPIVTRRMVLNAAAGRPLDQGTSDTPALPPDPPPSAIAKAKHPARLGPKIAPPLATRR